MGWVPESILIITILNCPSITALERTHTPFILNGTYSGVVEGLWKHRWPSTSPLEASLIPKGSFKMWKCPIYKYLPWPSSWPSIAELVLFYRGGAKAMDCSPVKSLHVLGLCTTDNLRQKLQNSDRQKPHPTSARNTHTDLYSCNDYLRSIYPGNCSQPSRHVLKTTGPSELFLCTHLAVLCKGLGHPWVLEPVRHPGINHPHIKWVSCVVTEVGFCTFPLPLIGHQGI